MPRLFIHKTTRVIKRATVDPEVQPLPDEDAVEVTFNPNLRAQGKFWKLSLDNSQVEEATEQDIEDSDVDEERVGRRVHALKQELNELIDDIADNGDTYTNAQNINKMVRYFKLTKRIRNRR